MVMSAQLNLMLQLRTDFPREQNRKCELPPSLAWDGQGEVEAQFFSSPNLEQSPPFGKPCSVPPAIVTILEFSTGGQQLLFGLLN